MRGKLAKKSLKFAPHSMNEKERKSQCLQGFDGI